jgi:hypothetical protein
MANTTNYNWETPDDTDLVKDGAAAIRTLGNSIDTTTKALNPETTLGDIAYRSATSNTNTRLPIGSNGQILGVSAGVPAWINNDQGDITEVQAGTGISVASGTGPIPVVTNTVATAIDAKGDLIVGTGADTFARLAVGTNGHTLVADSAETTGLKWAAPAGSSGPTFRAYRNTNQTVSTGTWVKVDFDTENWDTASNFASARFTATTSGYYQFNYMVNFAGTANNIVLYKNGARYSGGHFGNEDGWKNGSCLVYLNGSSDYVEIYVYTNNATLYGGSDQTMFDGVWIRS